MKRWIWSYVRDYRQRRPWNADSEIHVLICIADHYEPKSGNAPPELAEARVHKWVTEYPRQFGGFRDSDGRPPRYTFFYPIEEYEPDYLDALADLCRQGYAEVEIHYHHEDDTAENLRRELTRFKNTLADRHQLLSRHRETGAVMYGFVHGNWALCNSQPDGSCCGVNEELDVLRETGCYADFTFPSAPDVTQPPILNRIYYARNQPGRPRSHEVGWEIGRGDIPEDSLLLIQGPLLLNWQKRKWGLVPRIENGCIQGSQPPSMERLDRWLAARIQVPRRPDWYFVKLHSHGAEEKSHQALLGDPMVQFHRALAKRAAENPRFHFHYVTAREMVNLAKAAETGWTGSVNDARDFLLISNVENKMSEPMLTGSCSGNCA